ncbi:YdcF family protein [Leifsonia poae]|uniref:YdcF family protein n=1 Tax=Leifsonia poae TaxID=110933 RepID=UPI003D686040
MKAAVLVSIAVVVLVWSEAVHTRASTRRLSPRAEADPLVEAVVVLGYRNRGTRANYLNRYRVRAGLRSFDDRARERLLILCGGPVAGDIAEATLMADYARTMGYTGALRLDTESLSTWENITNAIPLLEGADSIKVVSNSLHAEKGRAYLWKLRPDLAARLRRGSDHRFGEIILLKPIAAVIGLRGLRGLPPG